MLSESGTAPGLMQAMPLPEGMAPTSAEVIASLNEHLVLTLQVIYLLLTVRRGFILNGNVLQKVIYAFLEQFFSVES